MKISVVIPCLNAESLLPVALEALTRQSRAPWEVIVADNGSTDGSREAALSFSGRLPRLQVVDGSARRGAAAARNAGAARATGDCLAFCDADDEVDERWLEALTAALSEHDFVASRLEFSRLNEPTSYRHEQETGLQLLQFGFLPHASGSGLAIRRRVFEAAGGFDEDVRFHEDTAFCWKLHLAGTPLGFADAAVVHLRRRGSASGALRQARSWAACEVLLYRRFRDAGMPPPRNGNALREWLRMPRMLLQSVRGRRSWYGFCWHFGTRLGRAQGSLTYRTLML
ncbi:MAG: glycosyltransferase family 2 protein [Pseudomonadales bacterium]